MSWSRVSDNPTNVSAYSFTSSEGQQVRLSIGLQSVILSESDAASLGGYLMAVTNNPPAETPPETGALEVIKPLEVSEEGLAAMRGEEKESLSPSHRYQDVKDN